MIPAAEDFGEIKRRMRELREEQGMLDDDPLTAATDALEAIASTFGLNREHGETDIQLRARILIKMTAHRGGHLLGDFP